MRDLTAIKKHCISSGEDGQSFLFKTPAGLLRVVASTGNGWDHVSVSLDHRLPSWTEMHAIKRLFFEDDEVCMQLHLDVVNHVNAHPNSLHLWRPQPGSGKGRIPLPPIYLV